MRENFERISYGHETRLLIDFGDSCQNCGALLGRYHLPGCPYEECAQCHRALITCRCRAMESMEQLRIAIEMAGNFSWYGEAFEYAPKKRDTGENINLLELAAVSRLVFDHLDILNPSVKPVGFDGSGKKVFAERDLAKAFALKPRVLEEAMKIRLCQQHSPSEAWC